MRVVALITSARELLLCSFGHGAGVLCTYGCVWSGVRARSWYVRPQKGGDLRTKSSEVDFILKKREF